jgi:hypothetical protein
MVVSIRKERVIIVIKHRLQEMKRSKPVIEEHLPPLLKRDCT